MELNKKCKFCQLPLNFKNAAKKNRLYYRNECKKCRSQNVVKYNNGNLKRKLYMQEYVRRKGIVKTYPCETCNLQCYKKYARAFCSDKCRFLSYVQKVEDGCWIWRGTLTRRGYGKLSFKKNKSAIASRVAYELFCGPISEGKIVCHACDIPSCVNPDHLWSGDHLENMMDMTEKGRQHSKLTNVQVFKIRQLWENGWSQKKIMDLYNVSSGNLSNIIHRRIWKHV